MSKQINEFKVRNKNRKGNKTRRKLTREIKRINTKRKTTKKNNRKKTIKNKYRKTNRNKKTPKKQYQVGGELNPFTKGKYIKKIKKLAALFGEDAQIPQDDDAIVNMLGMYNKRYSELLSEQIDSGGGDLSDILNYILVNYSMENDRISKGKNPPKYGIGEKSFEQKIINKVNKVIAENKFVLQSFLIKYLPKILEYISDYINKSIDKTKLNISGYINKSIDKTKLNFDSELKNKITSGISESISDTYSEVEIAHLREKFQQGLQPEIDRIDPATYYTEVD